MIFFAFAATGLAAPAMALNIQATFDDTGSGGAWTVAQKAAVNAAITEYESAISDSTTVTLTFVNSSGGLGQSSTLYVPETYSSFLTRLAATSSGDATDQYVHSALGTSASADPVIGGSNIHLTTALARQLGYTNFSIGTGSDSTINLNTSLCYTNRSSPSGTLYDLQAVAMHEMDEVFGASSSMSAGESTLPTMINAADLFRFSNTAGTVRSFTHSSAATSYLVINGIKLAQFNQGDGTSNGGDFGDYAKTSISGASPHVQDAFGTPGVNLDLSSSELTLLDAAGWTLTAVPEPAGTAAVPVFAAAIAIVVRRRRRKV